MLLDPSTFDTITVEEFLEILRSASEPEIVETLGGPHRLAILDAVFGRLPELFAPARARGVSQVTQFRITGGPAEQPEDVYEVVIDDGRCWVPEDPGPDYDVSLRMGPVELARMLTGQGNPTMLVMRGKISVRGDISGARRFSSYFARG